MKKIGFVMRFFRLPVLLLSLLIMLLLAACGGGGGGDSTSDVKSPPAADGAPVAKNDAATTTVDTAVKIVVLANDSGGGGAPFEVKIVTNPTRGSVSVNSQSDVVTYTPNKGVTGSDSFNYTFTDSKGVRSNQARVDITIQSGATKPPPDEKPVARDDSATTPASTPVRIVVLANDTAVNDKTITVHIVKKPEKGTTSVDRSGVVTYAPRKGGSGSDSFRYNFTDAKGVVSNQATVTVSIACPAIHPHENYLAIGDSLTAGTGDNITSDNVTADGCYKGRGYPPVLVDKLNNAKSRKHTVVNKGQPGARSLDGDRSVGGLLGGESMHVLVLYGTNDSNGAASGSGVGPSAFRANMQSIIDQIHARGKKAYLAKIPPVLGETTDGSKYPNLDQGERNVLIRKYNQVVIELVRQNGISVQPPDFYNFFINKPHLYSDNVHLNGKGYQAMADLWFQKLKSL